MATFLQGFFFNFGVNLYIGRIETRGKKNGKQWKIKQIRRGYFAGVLSGIIYIYIIYIYISIYTHMCTYAIRFLE